MKVLSTLLSVAVIALEGTSFAWTNSLLPSGQALAWRDTGSYSVVIPAQASAQEKLAASLLADRIEVMTGERWQVVRQRPVTGYCVTLATRSSGLGEEGYELSERQGNWLLAGGSRRGPINAVLAFLEEDLGWRSYSIFVPETLPDWRDRPLKAVPRKFIPIWKNREVYSKCAWNAQWAMLNRQAPFFNPMGVEFPREAGGCEHYVPGHFAHTFRPFAPSRQVFKAHPEWFALIHGNRIPTNFCLTSTGLIDHLVQRIDRLYQRHPLATFCSLSLNDGGNQLCQCDSCKALAKSEGSGAGPLLKLVNRVAEKLGEKRPDARLTTLAYLDTVKLPKTIRPAKNLVIFLATDKHIWEHPYHMVSETDEVQKALRDWNGSGAELHLWDYIFGDNANWLAPSPNFDVIAENLRFYSQFKSLKGMLMQDNYRSIGGTRGAMKIWIVGKLLWNPHWDVKALERDFTLGYYGAAGPFMQAYNDLLRREWLAYHRTYRPQDGKAFQFSEGFQEEAEKLLNEAAQAVADDPVRHKEVEREVATLLYRRLQNADIVGGDEGWQQAIARMRGYCKRLDITNFHEAEPLEKHFLMWQARLVNGKIRLSSANSLFLALDRAHLPRCGTSTASMVTSKDSFTGNAIRQPAGPFTWSVQWRINPTTFLKGAGNWKVRLRIKPGPKRGEGQVLKCGIYSYDSAKILTERIFTTKDLEGDGFRWVDLGHLKDLRRELCIYAGSQPDCKLSWVELEVVEFVPEDGK